MSLLEFQKRILELALNNEEVILIAFNEVEYKEFCNKKGLIDSDEARLKWCNFKANPTTKLRQNNKVKKVCVICGIEFLATKHAKTCSHNCRQKLSLNKKIR